MATQGQYSGKQTGTFGFEVAGGDYLTIIKEGNFVIPQELQDESGRFSMQRAREVISLLRRDNKTTKYICSTLPGVNLDGEPNREVSISWE